MQQLVWNNITVCQSAAQPHARCRRSVAPTAASRVQAWKITRSSPWDKYWKMWQRVNDLQSWISSTSVFHKVFDSDHRPALWKILKLYGLPMKVITIIQKLKLYEESYCSLRWHKQLVLGGNGSSSRLHSIATAVCNCDWLGATQDHRQQYWRHRVRRTRPLVWPRFCWWHRTYYRLLVQYATDNYSFNNESPQSWPVHQSREVQNSMSFNGLQFSHRLYRFIFICLALVASQICEITHKSKKIQISDLQQFEVIDLDANRKCINLLSVINRNFMYFLPSSRYWRTG